MKDTILRLRPIVAYPTRKALLADLAGGEGKDHRGRLFGWNIEVDSIQAEKYNDGGESRTLISIDKRIIPRDAKAICGSEDRQVTLTVTKFVDRSCQRRFQETYIPHSVGTPEKG